MLDVSRIIRKDAKYAFSAELMVVFFAKSSALVSFFVRKLVEGGLKARGILCV